MRVLDYAERFIEGYLFSDLASMKDVSLPPLVDGHLGYPMFMACASGIEVLGLLISPTPYTKESARGDNGPSKNFERYWVNYLYDQGDRQGVGEAVFQLIRNGVAHTFAAKAPTVSKRGPHLERVNGTTNVNVVQLADDFQASYATCVRPVLEGKAPGRLHETSVSMQSRLDELLMLDESKIKHHEKSLGRLPEYSPTSAIGNPVTQTSTSVAGVTSSLGPTGVMSNSISTFISSLPPKK